MKWSGAPRPFCPSLWVWLTFCNKNIPSILKAGCSASSFVRGRVTISARLHKRHQITGVCLIFCCYCFFFLNKKFHVFPLLSIFPYRPSGMPHVGHREKDSTSGWYLQTETNITLTHAWILKCCFFGVLLFFFSFVKQCRNVSQHHHYIIEKECRKYGPAHFK